MRIRSLETKQRIKGFVENFYLENSRCPSSGEIAEGLGMVKSTVFRYLVEMDDERMISYDHGKVRTGKIDKVNTDVVNMGIIGAVSCGQPELTEEYVEEYIPLPAALFGKGEFYILRAHGDSMVDAGINDKDLVIIRKQEEANEGQIVVALVNNETTLKRFYRDRKMNCVRLHPENKAMEDIIVPDCKIQGVAVDVIKKLE